MGVYKQFFDSSFNLIKLPFHFYGAMLHNEGLSFQFAGLTQQIDRATNQ